MQKVASLFLPFKKKVWKAKLALRATVGLNGAESGNGIWRVSLELKVASNKEVG